MDKDIKVTWEGQRRFVGVNESGQSVAMDATVAAGGDASAPTPLELVLDALAACTAIDVVGILEKKRQPLVGLVIEVHAEQSRDESPKPYDYINLVYVVEGDVSAKAIDDAMRLSFEKYCSVKAMLGPNIKIDTSWRYKGDSE